MMIPEPNRSVRFRAALKREIPILTAHGILTEEGKHRLESIYGLDQLQKESSRLLTAVLFTIGSLLIGGGAISFVAAHWNEIPKGSRVGLLMATLLAFYISGYQLRYKAGRSGLGHALIFCGCLVFGANIGLLAQIYHVNGSWYAAFGAWALGSLAIAWVTRSWITGLLVVVTSITWFIGMTEDYHERLGTIYPPLLAGALLPLAWIIRSRALYTVTFLGFIYGLMSLAEVQTRKWNYILIALAAGGLVAWVVGEFHRTSGIREEFGNPISYLGLATLAIGTYIWSFHESWKPDYHTSPSQFYWLIPVGLALVIAAILVIRIWEGPATSQMSLLVSAVLIFASICLAAALKGFGHVAPTILMNLAALVTAGLAIARGIIEERRITFWAGALFIAALVISRFFEYDTSLLIKSAVFVACGTAVMLAGVAYERFLRRKEVFAK